MIVSVAGIDVGGGIIVGVGMTSAAPCGGREYAATRRRTSSTTKMAVPRFNKIKMMSGTRRQDNDSPLRPLR
jgi:hypothetical protein